MNPNEYITPILGIFVGILMGLTGAGGGILSVPLLVFFLHLPVSEASPIALSAITLSATIGAIQGLREKVLRYRAALLISSFGLIMSPIGLWVAKITPNSPLQIIFGVVLLFVSMRLYMQAHQTIKGTLPVASTPPPCQLDLHIGKLIWNVPCARALILSGMTAGFLSGLLGVGGGFVLVPSLKKFTDLPMKSIVATSLGVLAIVSAGGALVTFASGRLNIDLAIPFALGSMFGIILGKVLESKISGNRVQQVFAIFAFLVAINLIYMAL
jgi:uncharacterized membrane protein YfcA